MRELGRGSQGGNPCFRRGPLIRVGGSRHFRGVEKGHPNGSRSDSASFCAREQIPGSTPEDCDITCELLVGVPCGRARGPSGRQSQRRDWSQAAMPSEPRTAINNRRSLNRAARRQAGVCIEAWSHGPALKSGFCEDCLAQHVKSVKAYKARKIAADPTWILRERSKGREWQKKYREANREQHRLRNLELYRDPERRARRAELRRLRVHGLTTSEFASLLNNQDNCCAICRCAFVHDQQRHVDHDHETGKLRGILCAACNLGIGMFHDNPAVLLKAVDYLRSAEVRHAV